MSYSVRKKVILVSISLFSAPVSAKIPLIMSYKFYIQSRVITTAAVSNPGNGIHIICGDGEEGSSLWAFVLVHFFSLGCYPEEICSPSLARKLKSWREKDDNASTKQYINFPDNSLAHRMPYV